MIVAALRLLLALLGIVLLTAVTVTGIAIAISSVQGGDGTLSYSQLAGWLDLAAFRDTVGAWLDGLESRGSVDVAAALAGAGAVAVGAALVVGAVVARRERLLILDRSAAGRLAMRRRTAAGALTALAERPREVLAARVRVRPNRHKVGGRASARLDRARVADPAEVRAAAAKSADGLVGEMSLKLRLHDRIPRRSGRVK